MAKLKDARHHAEKIEYFYNHAAERGYQQAVFHWDELCNLERNAKKNEQGIIHALRKSCQTIMDEMRRKENSPGI